MADPEFRKRWRIMAEPLVGLGADPLVGVPRSKEWSLLETESFLSIFYREGPKVKDL